MSGDLEECENTTEEHCVPLSRQPSLLVEIICPVPRIKTWVESRGWQGASGLMAGWTVSSCLSSLLSAQTTTVVRCLESCFSAHYTPDGWLHRRFTRLLLYGRGGIEVKPRHVPQSAVNGYDVWSAALHPNVAQSELSLCKWPLVQRRRRWSGAKGEEKGPSYLRNETAPTQSKQSFRPLMLQDTYVYPVLLCLKHVHGMLC